MTSGVYKLTSPSGCFYIGKSVNIETRWKQHSDKLLKGKAAANMQAEFNAYGDFSSEVLFACHPDHIDLVEAMYINRLRPQLNGTYPEDPFSGVDTEEELTKILELLNMSTLQHVNKIYEFDAGQNINLAVVAELREEVKDLSIKRSKEMVMADLDNRLEEKDSKIYDLERTNEVLKRCLTDADRLLTYHNLPWYKKLF